MLEHWNILVGRQPIRDIGLRTDDGWDISGDDVQIWLEEQGENSFTISAYCEKLLPMLRKEEGRAWWMLTTLTDQVLGEISHMWYIDGFDVLEGPRAEPSLLLSQLPDKLKERGVDLSTAPEAYLDSCLAYKMEPNKDPDADWRLEMCIRDRWITDPQQIGIPKMEFVGGYPNEYCIFLKSLTETELEQIASLDGTPLDMTEELRQHLTGKDKPYGATG